MNLSTDRSGVSFMDEFFPTRCVVSPNDVEEIRVWTDYSNISNINKLVQKVLGT